MIIATPDFGAGATLGVILVLAWGMILLTAAVGFAWGMKLLQHQSQKERAKGRLLVWACCMVPLLCCLGPPNAVRVISGNYPLSGDPHERVSKGMTKEEVKAALGAPHERYDGGDREIWYYWMDSFGINYCSVWFDAKGRVANTYGN